jgi:hypothetical protein
MTSPGNATEGVYICTRWASFCKQTKGEPSLTVVTMDYAKGDPSLTVVTVDSVARQTTGMVRRL